MPLIQESDRVQIKTRLESMQEPVTIINFSQHFECDFCRETRQLAKEVGELSDRIKVETFDFQDDKDMVEKYHVDKIPATIVMNSKDYGIRFFGIPSGYEFIGLLEAILMVSKTDSGLSGDSKKRLAELTKPIHLQVFVTPT